MTAKQHIEAALQALTEQREALPFGSDARIPFDVALSGLVQALDALA